jgi:GntR family transcriptional regulator
MSELGFTAGSHVLRSVVEPSSGYVADRLRLIEGEPVVTIVRLRLGAGVPLGLQTAHLPALRFPGLDAIDLAGRSLYATLAERYGVVPVEAEELFEVAPIRGEAARLLQVRPGSCGFHVERLTFDSRGAFEFASSLMRGDRYSIRMGLRPPT